MRFLGMRTLTKYLQGGHPGPDASIFKLYWSEYHRVVHRAGRRHPRRRGHGAPSGRWPSNAFQADDAGAPNDSASWVGTFLVARAGTIYAGTSQVQRNIIGEMVLGLPKEPGSPRGTWRELQQHEGVSAPARRGRWIVRAGAGRGGAPGAVGHRGAPGAGAGRAGVVAARRRTCPCPTRPTSASGCRPPTAIPTASPSRPTSSPTSTGAGPGPASPADAPAAEHPIRRSIRAGWLDYPRCAWAGRWCSTPPMNHSRSSPTAGPSVLVLSDKADVLHETGEALHSERLTRAGPVGGPAALVRAGAVPAPGRHQPSRGVPARRRRVPVLRQPGREHRPRGASQPRAASTSGRTWSPPAAGATPSSATATSTRRDAAARRPGRAPAPELGQRARRSGPRAVGALPRRRRHPPRDRRRPGAAHPAVCLEGVEVELVRVRLPLRRGADARPTATESVREVVLVRAVARRRRGGLGRVQRAGARRPTPASTPTARGRCCATCWRRPRWPAGRVSCVGHPMASAAGRARPRRPALRARRRRAGSTPSPIGPEGRRDWSGPPCSASTRRSTSWWRRDDGPAIAGHSAQAQDPTRRDLEPLAAVRAAFPASPVWTPTAASGATRTE